MPAMSEDAARAAAGMHEEIWSTVPADAPPFAWERRRAFLLANVAPGDDVLDLGSGDGSFSAALAQAGARPVAVDVAAAAVDRARARHPALDVRHAPAGEPLPVDDAAVDVVWASEVLAFVPDTARLLSEIRRVLRPGGRLLVTTPYHGRVRTLIRGLGEEFDPVGPTLRHYTRPSLRSTLAEFGFDEVRVTAAGGPPLLRETLLARARRSPLRAPGTPP